MLYSQVSKEILSCIHPCKLNNSNGQRLDSFKETLQNCSGKTEETCYQRALNKARKVINRKGLKNPVKKLNTRSSIQALNMMRITKAKYPKTLQDSFSASQKNP